MSVGSTGPAGETPATVSRDPYALVRTRGYLKLLLVAAVVGFPVCAVAFGFLALVHELEPLIYADLPRALGFAGTPLWWPVPMLVVAGLLVGLAIRHLPGNGGHEPADGLALRGAPRSPRSPASRSRRWPPSASVRWSAPRRRSSPSAADWPRAPHGCWAGA